MQAGVVPVTINALLMPLNVSSAMPMRIFEKVDDGFLAGFWSSSDRDDHLGELPDGINCRW